jgi:hypothetical protein
MARNYYDEWYDLMRMKPQFYNPLTGAAADKFHKGFFWPSSWQRPDEQYTDRIMTQAVKEIPPTNLGITQTPPYTDRIMTQAVKETPVDEPTGLFGKSNLGGLIGDNKMAAALMALRGLEAGSRGQNILQAAAPAAMGGLSDAFIIEKYKDIKKKTKAKEKIQKSKKFTEREKLAMEAGIKLPSSKATAKMKEFESFKKIDWDNPLEVAAANAVYIGESKTKFMKPIAAKIAAQAASEGWKDEETLKALNFYENYYDNVLKKMDMSEEKISDVSAGNELIKNFKGNAKQVEQLSILYNHPNNKNIPVEELIEYVKQNY